ncbi:MAG: hypothetical protein C4308_05805 [Chitinophagaceae bacterium]
MAIDETSFPFPAEEPQNNSSSPEQIVYPPKPAKEIKKGNVWIKSITSLALYLLVGYYFFSANWPILLILTGIVIFHELGHFAAMKIFKYQELGIFFIPLLGAYASGTKREVSQLQSSIILLAGPLPGIIAGVVIYFLLPHYGALGMKFEAWVLLRYTSGLLIFLNLLNLLPIYPLDGGQLLNRLFLDESNILYKIFVIASAIALGFFAFRLQFYPLLVFPLMMLFRLGTDTQHDQLTKEVESRGINLEKTYEELTDEEYWKIRSILIEKNYPTLRHIPAEPYEYSADEKKVITAIENLLQRTIIQDLSIAGKVLIILIWLGCFTIPFLIPFYFPFIHR